eukprot:NODE_7234_length_494_cov_16.384270_g6793_i0.p1 GENE.NODE_7234_length_494_cov_16.384270_g6793_i0~~NODE_7234_length_494_cov_16.384270_g6793_i0.p1  ORF type:complete len:143 (-),score=21.94 NODE_7234_length_494_cov_16.384270_g6793_i0:40-468(-)
MAKVLYLRYLCLCLSVLSVYLSMLHIVGAAQVSSELGAETLHVESMNLEVDEKNDRLTYSPESHVMKASYTKFVFSLAKYRAIVGKDNLQRDHTVSIRRIDTKDSIFDPEVDAEEEPFCCAKPDGGFRNTIIRAECLALLPS